VEAKAFNAELDKVFKEYKKAIMLVTLSYVRLTNHRVEITGPTKAQGRCYLIEYSNWHTEK
jgi:hypothetical protein